ncbi:ParA family partition ATPase [Nisaea sp.]|uniref:ParA family partition ATPase n=1 Tax=Nisaea sp. TaxID=2024842 RepID=UPI003B518320
MTGTIITIAQQKGGAGKTTLAAQLAVALAHSGKSVAAIDIDPQMSLATWFRMRTSLNGEIAYRGKGALEIIQITGWRAAAEIEKQAKLHDVVIVDSPPHAETEAKIAVRNAHIVLIPVQPSPMDVWATKPTVDMAAAERTPVLLVLNRVPPRAKLTERMTAAVKELEVPVAKVSIGNRVALASSMADGLGVVEAAKRSVAAQEITALTKAALKAAG